MSSTNNLFTRFKTYLFFIGFKCSASIFEYLIQTLSEYEHAKNDTYELRACMNAQFSELERASIEQFDEKIELKSENKAKKLSSLDISFIRCTLQIRDFFANR